MVQKRRPPKLHARAARKMRRLNGDDSLKLADLVQFLDGATVERLAEERSITASDVVSALPKRARRFVSRARFVEVMNDVATWGPVTIPLRTSGGLIELTGLLPHGEVKHGHFYWLRESPLRGHLELDRCSGIAFVERAFMGRPSACVIFFDRAGGVMFKIFLPRDVSGALKQEQLNAFRDLARRLNARSAPPVRKQIADHAKTAHSAPSTSLEAQPE